MKETGSGLLGLYVTDVCLLCFWELQIYYLLVFVRHHFTQININMEGIWILIPNFEVGTLDFIRLFSL